MAQGAYEEASGNYQESLRLSPKNPVAMNNLAICQQRLGHAHETLALYRDLAVLNSELGQVQNNLGQVLQGLGQFRVESV